MREGQEQMGEPQEMREGQWEVGDGWGRDRGEGEGTGGDGEGTGVGRGGGDGGKEEMRETGREKEGWGLKGEKRCEKDRRRWERNGNRRR